MVRDNRILLLVVDSVGLWGNLNLGFGFVVGWKILFIFILVICFYKIIIILIININSLCKE